MVVCRAIVDLFLGFRLLLGQCASLVSASLARVCVVCVGGSVVVPIFLHFADRGCVHACVRECGCFVVAFIRFCSHFPSSLSPGLIQCILVAVPSRLLGDANAISSPQALPSSSSILPLPL